MAWLPLSLLCLGVGSVVAWWRIRALGDVREHLGAFYGWFGLAFLVYLAALWIVRCAERRDPLADDRHEPSRRAQQGPGPRRIRWLSLGLIVGCAAAARLMLLSSVPTLSDDIYRYRWDGRVQQAGIDPYLYAPNASEVTPLRDAQCTRINFPHLRTVYPPLTQLAFLAGVSLSDAVAAQKAVWAFAELLTIMSLALVLAHRRRSPLWVIAYAWHPLVVLEIAGSGHNDALGLAFLWMGLAAWDLRRYPTAAVGWALAFLAKYAAVLLLPWWWFRGVAKRALLVFLALAGLPLLLRPAAVGALVESLTAMSGRFESNASGYLLLTWLLGDASIARVAAVGLWVGLLLWWARRESDPIRYLFLGMTAAALLSPVLHPWYLVWIIPCLCFWPVPAVIALSATVVLAYTVWPGYLAQGRWQMPVWARALEYVPVVVLGLWSLSRRWTLKWLVRREEMV